MNQEKQTQEICNTELDGAPAILRRSRQRLENQEGRQEQHAKKHCGDNRGEEEIVFGVSHASLAPEAEKRTGHADSR